MNYGGGDEMLAGRLGVGLDEAARLRRLHQETYPTFWRNSDRFIASAFAARRMTSVFGWPIHVRPDDRPQSVLNFPVQSSAADMMRLAAVAGVEEGIQIAAPVHDAFVIVAPLDRFEQDIRHMQAIMQRAGAAVTGGMPVFTDVKRVIYPDRYADKRGTAMWQTVMSLLPRDRSLSFTHAAHPSPTLTHSPTRSVTHTHPPST
jgi:DNA polymerase I-like protein with 3'-5' exonuclease and polymerase domains